MRVLVTGHDGYIGTVLVPLFQAAGHEVVGLDSFLFSDCVFGDDVEPVPAIRTDIRDVTPADLEGFDAVVHLAALSNDPLGDLNPACTYDINHLGAVGVATAAKEAGVEMVDSADKTALGGGDLAWHSRIRIEIGIDVPSLGRHTRDGVDTVFHQLPKALGIMTTARHAAAQSNHRDRLTRGLLKHRYARLRLVQREECPFKRRQSDWVGSARDHRLNRSVHDLLNRSISMASISWSLIPAMVSASSA